jgi:hypothetical protein
MVFQWVAQSFPFLETLRLFCEWEKNRRVWEGQTLRYPLRDQVTRQSVR